MVGGGEQKFQGDVWAWDGGQWAELAITHTPIRSSHSLAYDATYNRYVLFGGVDRPGGQALNETWELVGQQWSCVESCP